MENRRLLLAVFLSALILMVWYAIFPPPPPSRPVESLDPGPGVEGPAPAREAEANGSIAPDEELPSFDTGVPDLDPPVDFDQDPVVAESVERPVL